MSRTPNKAKFNQSTALNATKIARMLRGQRPLNYLYDKESRMRWYTLVTCFADALREEHGRDWNASQFFDDCGVPT